MLLKMVTEKVLYIVPSISMFRHFSVDKTQKSIKKYPFENVKLGSKA